MGPGRRVFAVPQFYNKVNTTVSDDVATAFSDGSTGGSTWLGSAGTNWNMQPANFPVLTNGQTYTIAITAQRNTVTDQSFCFAINGTRVGAVKTATATMQRFTHTFVASGSSAYIASSDGISGADLLVRDFGLFAGSVDLHEEPAGHLMLGRCKGINEPATAGGEMDMSNGTARAYFQFANKVSFASWTVQCVASQTAAGSSYQAFLSPLLGSNWTSFSAFFNQDNLPTIAFAGTTNIINSQFTQSFGLWNFLNKGHHLITCSYGAGVARIFVDDVQIVACETSAYSAQSLADFWVGALNSSFGTGHKIQGLALWDRSLSKEEISNSYDFWLSKCAASGVPLSTIDRFVVFEGDSITAQVTSPTYPHLYGRNATLPCIGAVWARSSSFIGTTAINMQSRKSNLLNVIPAKKRGRKFILSAMITNDLTSRTSTQYIDDFSAILADYRTAGFDKIAIGTPPPRADASYNTRRAAVLAPLRAWEGVTVDGVFDLAADATYGPDAAGSNTTYYPDGVHPSAAVEAYWEANIVRAELDAL